MGRVSGELRLVTERPALVSQVRVRAARDRAEGGGLTTRFDDVVPVHNGYVETDLLPGPAVMVLEESGGFSHVVELLVPDRDTSLEECVRAAGDADEYSKRELEQMVLEVREFYPKFGEVAVAAEKSASEAATSSLSASGYAEAARGHAVAAGEARDDAEDQAGKAREHAESASTSESNASEHASTAARHEVAAKGYAGDAEGSAESAREDADRAATIAGSTRWVGTKLEVNGQMSQSLMPVLEVSDQGTWVINGVDTGQLARGPGGASAWEDISGKPSAFPPAEHTHNINDLDGVGHFGDGLLDQMSEILNHAHQEGYIVDSESVDQKVGALRAEMQSRPAFFSGAGKPPASVPGARVGDYWLDESTMELHKITGV